MTGEPLTSNQAYALLDILSHAETYQEIRDFREPGSLDQYGPPFDAPAKTPSRFPALQTLVSRFLLTMPCLKDLPDEFWKVQCASIIDSFEKADLSESYDKGILGSRKTAATGISALIEYPLRGTYGGFEELKGYSKDYDLTKEDDLFRAFRHCMNEMVYGGILDELVLKAAETDKLSDHDPIIQAVHEFVLVNLASFMHYMFILSPKGQYFLKLIDNANKLVPYMVIRQTLKIGNVASMISAMMKVVLAKMSVTSMTNWIGLTAAADEGMNLLQYIISTVLNWDIAELEKRAAKLERERAEAGQKQLHAIKAYGNKSREDHKRIRRDSERNSKSIVTAILEDANLPSDLTIEHHKQALEYLSIHLSIRDRKQIIQVLCRSQPDYLTQSLKELVAVYEPNIRQLHNAVDLSDTVSDAEHFIHDMIKTSQIRTDKSGKSIVPTVGDFIQLLRKHQYSSHKFIHQCCKNGPEVVGWYLEWAKIAASHFRRERSSSSSQLTTAKDDTSTSTGIGAGTAAGALTEPLNTQFHSLPREMKKIILPILDQHAAYLESLHTSSRARLSAVLKSQPTSPTTHSNPQMSRILQKFPSHSHNNGGSNNKNTNNNNNNPSSLASSSRPSTPTVEDDPSSSSETSPPKISTDPGPGSYLERWQELLDGTAVTSATAHGPPRRGGHHEVVNQSAVDVDGERLVEIQQDHTGDRLREKVVSGGARPEVRPVLDAMLSGFRDMLASKSCYW